MLFTRKREKHSKLIEKDVNIEHDNENSFDSIEYTEYEKDKGNVEIKEKKKVSRNKLKGLRPKDKKRIILLEKEFEYIGECDANVSNHVDFLIKNIKNNLLYRVRQFIKLYNNNRRKAAANSIDVTIEEYEKIKPDEFSYDLEKAKVNKFEEIKSKNIYGEKLKFQNRLMKEMTTIIDVDKVRECIKEKKIIDPNGLPYTLPDFSIPKPNTYLSSEYYNKLQDKDYAIDHSKKTFGVNGYFQYAPDKEIDAPDYIDPYVDDSMKIEPLGRSFKTPPSRTAKTGWGIGVALFVILDVISMFILNWYADPPTIMYFVLAITNVLPVVLFTLASVYRFTLIKDRSFKRKWYIIFLLSACVVTTLDILSLTTLLLVAGELSNVEITIIMLLMTIGFVTASMLVFFSGSLLFNYHYLRFFVLRKQLRKDYNFFAACRELLTYVNDNIEFQFNDNTTVFHTSYEKIEKEKHNILKHLLIRQYIHPLYSFMDNMSNPVRRDYLPQITKMGKYGSDFEIPYIVESSDEEDINNETLFEQNVNNDPENMGTDTDTVEGSGTDSAESQKNSKEEGDIDDEK